MAGILLVSDIDGTLLGDDAALERFIHWIAPRRDRIRLVYASGRFFESVVHSVRTTLLPAPDVIIGGVGTQIRRYADGAEIGSWSQRWRRGWSAEAIRQALLKVPGLEPQPPEFLSDFKLSYFLRDATLQQLVKINDRLSEAVGRCQVVYSSRRDLDILPHGVDKGSAAAYLARHWRVSKEQVIVAGDSGNDLAMFTHGFRGIVVSNAHGELRDQVPPETFVAHEPFAAGVLAGLEHWMKALTPVRW